MLARVRTPWWLLFSLWVGCGSRTSEEVTSRGFGDDGRASREGPDAGQVSDDATASDGPESDRAGSDGAGSDGAGSDSPDDETGASDEPNVSTDETDVLDGDGAGGAAGGGGTDDVVDPPVHPSAGVGGASCVPTSAVTDPMRAARGLARALWGSEPDDELLQAAQSGDFEEPEGLLAQVHRLLDDPRALAHLGRFGEWWLSSDVDDPYFPSKSEQRHPSFDARLQSDMVEETRLFTESIVGDPDGVASSFLCAEHTFANAPVAELYGLEGSEAFKRLTLPPEERAGLFTHPHFLATTSIDDSNPVRRGFFLRTHVLCDYVPPHPGVEGPFPPEDDGLTTRQWYEAVLFDGSCWACHVYGTGMGFGFEHYDALGRYRTEEEGLPVDSTAIVRRLEGEQEEFADAPTMMRALALDGQVQRCMARQWLTFLLGRSRNDTTYQLARMPLDPDVDCEADPNAACSEALIPRRVEELLACATTDAGDVSIRELLVALSTSEFVMEGSFPCEVSSCLSGTEWCYSELSLDAEGAEQQLHECRSLEASSDPCAAEGSADGCECELSDTGDVVVRCDRR